VPIDEHQHVALPKLYGQPAYARPPRSFEASDRPPDVDDLPLEAEQTVEERELAETFGGQPNGTGGPSGGSTARPRRHGLRPRPFSLRTIGRLFGSRD